MSDYSYAGQEIVNFDSYITHPWTADTTIHVKVSLILVAGNGTPTPMLVTVGNVSVFNIC
jgi:hypothetical protein